MKKQRKTYTKEEVETALKAAGPVVKSGKIAVHQPDQHQPIFRTTSTNDPMKKP